MAQGVALAPARSDQGATVKITLLSENSIRLAYSFVSPDEIDEGVQRLAAAIA